MLGVELVGIVYPSRDVTTDAVNYEAGVLLLATVFVGANVYIFTDKHSLLHAIDQDGSDQVDTLMLIGHGSENGSFGPSVNVLLSAKAAEVVSKLLLAKITHVVL